MLPSNFTRAKIVATIGPACESGEELLALIRAGVDIFRLNMSHLTHERASNIIARIRRHSTKCAILVDIQGPKMRLTEVETPFAVAAGESQILTSGDDRTRAGRLVVAFDELVRLLQPGHHVLINDGLVRLKMLERLSELEVETVVVDGGIVSSKKGVASPDLRLIPEQLLDDDDRRDITFAARRQVDFVAMSFVSRADDIRTVRAALGDAGAAIQIVAKVETRVGVDNIHEIVAEADGVMVARGDLGVEIPPEEVPLIQKRIIKICNAAAKPVVVATQMLESMVGNPVASRAETSDVANAILDGTDAVMLSAETSVGQYPVQAVQTLVRISHHIQRQAAMFREDLFQRPSHSTVEFLCKAAARVAEELNLRAIVSLTSSGFTARNMSSFRPRVPILATTPHASVVRRLRLSYGVYCIEAEHIGRYDVMLLQSLSKLIDDGALADDDLIAVIGGLPVGQSGTTNTLQVGTVAELVRVFGD